MKRQFALGCLVILCACGDRSGLPRARSLSPEDADHRLAGYSPDGARLYWWQQEDGLWHLYVSPADMSSPQRLPLASIGVPDNPLIWSPDGSRFAVAIAPDGPFPNVWLMPAAGGEPRRLTPENDFGIPVGWHPDGRRLSYATVLDQTIYTMVQDVDSGTPRRMLPGESRGHIAFWSPDASRLAILHFGQGRNTISLTDSVGHVLAATSDGFEGLEGRVTPWSPDGSAILYSSRRTGTSDLWVQPADGSAPRQLTSDVRDDRGAEWSPDGRWIAFHSNRGRQHDVWVVPAAGGEASRVTDDTRNEGAPWWRPGSGEIAFDVSSQRRSLWVHALAGGAERQLTNDSLDVETFEVASTGLVLIRIARGGSVDDFATVPLSGGEPRVVLRDARSGFAVWSPDGSRILFSSTRAGSNADVWVMDSAGGDLRRLTSWPETEDVPLFSPEGNAVTFWSDHQATWGDLWRVPVTGGEPVRLTNTGRVLGLCWQPYRVREAFAAVIADAPVTVAAVRVRSNGSLQPLWDRTTADCGFVSPTADSVAITTATAGGGFQTMLVPLSGGPGRPLLEPNQGIRPWSPDGRRLAFTYSVSSPYDLGVLDLADGSTRRITNTPASEELAEWSPDGSALVFNRVVPVSRITTANVSRLLTR